MAHWHYIYFVSSTEEQLWGYMCRLNDPTERLMIWCNLDLNIDLQDCVCLMQYCSCWFLIVLCFVVTKSLCLDWCRVSSLCLTSDFDLCMTGRTCPSLGPPDNSLPCPVWVPYLQPTSHQSYWFMNNDWANSILDAPCEGKQKVLRICRDWRDHYRRSGGGALSGWQEIIIINVKLESVWMSLYDLQAGGASLPNW